MEYLETTRFGELLKPIQTLKYIEPLWMEQSIWASFFFFFFFGSDFLFLFLIPFLVLFNLSLHLTFYAETVSGSIQMGYPL
jgi:hypothetical protein